MQMITKLWLVPSAKSTEILVLDHQRTQRITESAFRISLQPDWRSRQTKKKAFLTGQSWRVLKSGYTAGNPEQGFRRCTADGVNQSLISSARRLSSGKEKKVVVSAETYISYPPYNQSTIQIIQQGEPINVPSLLTLKKVLKTYELENASSTMAKNVLKPPFHTAGPISRKVARARSKK